MQFKQYFENMHTYLKIYKNLYIFSVIYNLFYLFNLQICSFFFSFYNSIILL